MNEQQFSLEDYVKHHRPLFKRLSKTELLEMTLDYGYANYRQAMTIRELSKKETQSVRQCAWCGEMVEPHLHVFCPALERDE